MAIDEFWEQEQLGDVAQPKFDMYTPTSLQKYRLGARHHRPDGRTFHYARAGGTALIRGQLIQSAVNSSGTTEQQDMTIPFASAVDDDYGWATLKTDAALENQYNGGWYVVSDDTVAQGGGGTYQVKSHPSVGAGGNIKCTFYDKIPVLISASGKAGLIQSPYNGAIQCPTTSTGWVIGVTMSAVTANYYCWLQTWGMGSVLAAGGIAVGEQVVRGPAVAGACAAQDAGAGSDEYEIIGICGHTTDDTDWGFVYLQIRP